MKAVKLILCDECKNYKVCKSFWWGSVNSINCEIEYGLFEPIESEANNEKRTEGTI